MNNEKGEFMKNIYEEPVMNIICFSTEDIMIKSGDGNAVLPDDEF